MLQIAKVICENVKRKWYLNDSDQIIFLAHHTQNISQHHIVHQLLFKPCCWAYVGLVPFQRNPCYNQNHIHTISVLTGCKRTLDLTLYTYTPKVMIILPMPTRWPLLPRDSHVAIVHVILGWRSHLPPRTMVLFLFILNM